MGFKSEEFPGHSPFRQDFGKLFSSHSCVNLAICAGRKHHGPGHSLLLNTVRNYEFEKIEKYTSKQIKRYQDITQ